MFFLLLKLTTHLKHLLDGSVLKDFSFLKKKTKKKCRFHFLHALFRRANTIATTHRKCQLSLPHRFGRLGFVCSLTPPPLFIVGGCTSFHKCAACSVVPTQLPLSPPPFTKKKKKNEEEEWSVEKRKKTCDTLSRRLCNNWPIYYRYSFCSKRSDLFRGRWTMNLSLELIIHMLANSWSSEGEGGSLSNCCNRCNTMAIKFYSQKKKKNTERRKMGKKQKSN